MHKKYIYIDSIFLLLSEMAKKFTKHPETLEVIEGETATFSCGPPKSNPDPSVSIRFTIPRDLPEFK